MLMLQIIGLLVAGIVGLLMAANAAFMLASPQAWFRLPGWMKMQGSLTKDEYTSGWRAVQVRLTGAAILGTMAWVLYDLLSGK